MDYDIVVADRDSQELNGILWLISNYAFPIATQHKAKHTIEFMDVLENKRPRIICLELDMIPKDKWEMVKQHIKNYADQVIAMTAEATFERASQALEVRALALWVKPLSPSMMKHTLQLAIQNLTSDGTGNASAPVMSQLGYESLFVDDQRPFSYAIYLLKTENQHDLPHLRQFIQQFDFRSQPSVFSVSDQIILVFHGEVSDPLSHAHRFMQEWELFSQGTLAIALHPGKGEKSVHQIYTQLRKTMKITFFTGFKQVLLSSDEPWKDFDPFLTPEEQRTWIAMLEKADKSAVKSWMYDKFFNFEAPYPAPGMLRTKLTSILAQLRRFMNRKELTGPEIEEFYKSIFKQVLDGAVLNRIVQDLILFIYQLLDEFEKHAQLKQVDPIEKAISYIEAHHADYKLGLEEVAAHVDRSPTYLSYLLNEKQGKSFRELLTDVRITKAKEKLLNTDASILSIANEVGYQNANYFSRVFKQVTQTTPTAFRKHR
ncbi:helix-turn-helix domain-containing protein [Thalassobacillus hwangdonensis]|uniref:Helix-turn-helix domain-containing protein n=1 Tax=Thalassobacillus hwangdonensis TaxID=546108 RepID=A0ABW3L4K3_9BACI